VPSRVEPFGNAAVEAMLAGRPVVAGATQGLREIVRPGENGELAAPGDAPDLADAIGRVLASWPEAVARAERARHEAQARYSPARYRRDLADLAARTTRPAAGRSDPRTAVPPS
jgi:glycosyltransferase involved in cell wall biosynthesis